MYWSTEGGVEIFVLFKLLRDNGGPVYPGAAGNQCALSLNLEALVPVP